jgi:hypothetical protein
MSDGKGIGIILRTPVETAKMAHYTMPFQNFRLWQIENKHLNVIENHHRSP